MEPMVIRAEGRELFRMAVELTPEVILEMVSHGCTGCVVAELGKLILRLADVATEQLIDLAAEKLRRGDV